MAKILVIDDSADVHTLVQETLGEEHSIFNESNWAKALPLILEKEINLVMVDVNMPGLKGDMVAQGLKKNMSHHSFVVVLFSAINEMELRIKAKSIGVDGYICKTFDKKVLSAKVRRYLPKIPV